MSHCADRPEPPRRGRALGSAFAQGFRPRRQPQQPLGVRRTGTHPASDPRAPCGSGHFRPPLLSLQLPPESPLTHRCPLAHLRGAEACRPPATPCGPGRQMHTTPRPSLRAPHVTALPLGDARGPWGAWYRGSRPWCQLDGHRASVTPTLGALQALGALQVLSHAFPQVHEGSAQPHIT